MSRTIEQIVAYDRFNDRYPKGTLILCNKCNIEKPVEDFGYRFKSKNGSLSCFVRKPCKECNKHRLRNINSNRKKPDWVSNDELWDTILYGNFLIKAFKNPIKRCPCCKEYKSRIYDYSHRRRGSYYTTYDYCKKCNSAKSSKRYIANKDRVRTRNRLLHQKHCKAATDSYVRKQILRKARQERYKNDPSLLPTINEQRLSLAKWRIDRFINKHK